MITNHSFGIDFLIRKCKEDKQKALIYVRITVDGERKEISIKEKIDSKIWDAKKEIARGNSLVIKQINKTIEEVRYQVRSQYRLLQENCSLITADTIKDAYLGIHALQKGHTLMELMDYFRKIWEPKTKKGGFKNYKSTMEYVKRFLISKYENDNIFLSQVNMELMTEFEHYVRHVPIKEYDPCFGNGVGKHIQRFKRILNWAVEIKWMKSNPVEKYSCPLKRSKRKKLDIQQLVLLEQKNFQDPTIQIIRDLFLFGCYTGLAFADVMSLNEEHLEWNTDGTVWCKLYRQKSDILSPVPLFTSAIRIISKYKTHPGAIRRGSIFPCFSNQHVNDRLKLIQEACEIPIPLTFHIARHTFAKTVALKNGIPLETVQMMMGHTKISTTQIYAEVDEEKILDDTSTLEEKLDRQRTIIKEKFLQQPD